MPKVKDLTITDFLFDIDQVGIIVPDMDKAQASMLALYGLEPEVDYIKDYDLFYRGEEAHPTAKVCAYRYMNVELEFIQPVGEGKSAWHDYLAMGQKGIHHIRYNVWNYKEARQLMLDHGYKPWIEGEGTGVEGLEYTYFDTLEDFGFVTEIINWHEVNKDPAPAGK